MQRKYGIGEILIFQRAEHEPELNGLECEVERYLDGYVDPATMEERDVQGYGVSFPDGRFRFAHEYQLRRRPPKDTLSTWEAMKGIWTPNTVEA